MVDFLKLKQRYYGGCLYEAAVSVEASILIYQTEKSSFHYHPIQKNKTRGMCSILLKKRVEKRNCLHHEASQGEKERRELIKGEKRLRGMSAIKPVSKEHYFTRQERMGINWKTFCFYYFFFLLMWWGFEKMKN